MTDIYDYYYLLYKHNNSDIFWIVNEDTCKYKLYDEIKDFTSLDETYYIVNKKYKEYIMNDIINNEFTRYRKLDMNRIHKIIYKTNINYDL